MQAYTSEDRAHHAKRSDTILEIIRENPGITTAKLFGMVGGTISARISDLRKLGYRIECKRTKGNNSYAYTLLGKEDGPAMAKKRNDKPSIKEILLICAAKELAEMYYAERKKARTLMFGCIASLIGFSCLLAMEAARAFY